MDLLCGSHPGPLSMNVKFIPHDTGNYAYLAIVALVTKNDFNMLSMLLKLSCVLLKAMYLLR